MAAGTTGSTSEDGDTYGIIGAAMAVHRELGCGFLEAVYRAALRVELHRRGIEARSEVALPIAYRGELLPLIYRVDFVCGGDILVEVKALDAIGTLEMAQVINYLKASGAHRALVLNFEAPSLQYRRVVLGYKEPDRSSPGGDRGGVASPPRTDIHR